jgi:hypothetical protein
VTAGGCKPERMIARPPSRSVEFFAKNLTWRD